MYHPIQCLAPTLDERTRHDHYGDEVNGELIIGKDLINDVGLSPSEEHNRLTDLQ